MSATGVRVLATPAVATGFALAGLETMTAETALAGRDRILTLVRDPTVAVLLVEEAMLGCCSAMERTQLLSRDQPIIVPFSSPAWVREPSRESMLILDILRRAIGYRVRIG